MTDSEFKKLIAYAKKLQRADTSGVAGNSVKDRRTAYLRGQGLQSIRIGEDLEGFVKRLQKKSKEKVLVDAVNPLAGKDALDVSVELKGYE